MTWSLTTLCFSNEIKWCLNICWHSKAELWWCWRTDGVWQSNCLVEESRLWRGSNLFISSVYLVPGLQPNWSITCLPHKTESKKWEMGYSWVLHDTSQLDWITTHYYSRHPFPFVSLSFYYSLHRVHFQFHASSVPVCAVLEDEPSCNRQLGGRGDTVAGAVTRDSRHTAPKYTHHPPPAGFSTYESDNSWVADMG